MTLVSQPLGCTGEKFQHEAAFYRGSEALVGTVLPFIREGIDRDEPVLVALLPERTRSLEEALGADAVHVDFVDMAELGRNPACIIPEWRRFVAELGSDRPVRGVAEPVWPGRRPAELEECRLHEALVNLAFADGPAWHLLCPYDMDALPAKVVEDAVRTHPVAGPDADGAIRYEGLGRAMADFAASLTPPPPNADEVPFGPDDLTVLRGLVARLCLRAGLSDATTDDLVLAAHELATNSVTHGGGRGALLAWSEPGAFVLEVRDTGTILDPLVGRDLAFDVSESGRGVWIANQMCDLVQVRSTSAGAVVRLHTWV